MFCLVSVLVSIIALNLSVDGSNVHHHHQGASYGLPSSIISSGGHGGHGHQGHSSLTNTRKLVSTPIVSSYSTSIVHPDSWILRPIANHNGYNSQIVHQHHHQQQEPQQHQHHVISPVTHQLPASSQLFLGHSNSHHNTNSYAIQSSYNVPLAPHGIYSASLASTHNGLSRW
ncbi:uncharacterized protein LOC129948553 [Eupeodes corollae]|uniref:uncharacterized protein LOC129948553 n=1 Tax=Eupeodes corollae TaxID=290404 RepID=UPI00249229A3|nr:uncharacterized protein LOC129948553 [Eupeodes corollae]